MPKLGSRENPAIVRVQTTQRGEEILALCSERGWRVLVGIETDKSEDITDVDRLLNPPQPVVNNNAQGRNDKCYCGSGKKYKNCCMNNIQNEK